MIEDPDPFGEPFPWLAVLGCLICLIVGVVMFFTAGCSTSTPC